MTGHDQWDELAAGYALHALSPEDSERFVAHLEGCTECAESLAQHEYVAAQLGSISHFPDTDDAPSWESIRASVIGAREPGAPVVDLAQRRRYAVSRRALAAAAAVVIVAGGGIATWRLTTGGSSSCVASSGCHLVKLDAGNRTLASLVVRDNRVTVTPTDMPAAPTGKVYVLWQLPRNGRAKAIGEFTAGSGANAATSALTAPYSDTAAFAVSLEPAGPPPVMPSNTLASGTAP